MALANNERVSRYLVDTFPYPYTRRDADWWIGIGSRQDGAVTKAIEWRGELVGSVGITPGTGWKQHLAEIGYWVGEDYWGHGIATAALGEMTTLAFEQLGFRKLFAPVLAPNTASMRVLEKNGYRLEGVHRQEVEKHGEYFDTYHYARQRGLGGVSLPGDEGT